MVDLQRKKSTQIKKRYYLDIASNFARVKVKYAPTFISGNDSGKIGFVSLNYLNIRNLVDRGKALVSLLKCGKDPA